MTWNVFTDLTSWVYLVEAGICSLGFGIFAWWWVRQKTASEVYAYITFLLLAIAFERATALSVRVIYLLGDPGKVEDILTSFSWSMRTVPGTVIMFLIVYRMALRAWRTVKLETQYSKDRDNTCEEEFENGQEKGIDS